MRIDPKQLAEEFRQLRRNEPTKVATDFDEESECAHLADLLNDEPELARYSSAHPSGAGGSGVVINAIYDPLESIRAIKTPRKKTRVSTEPQKDLFVDPELHALSKLSHENITRLYEAFRLKNGGVCTVTEYVQGARSLDQYAEQLCCTGPCKTNEHILLAASRDLARIIYRVSVALMYMHQSANLIHFDVKPDNILVAGNGHPYVADLGFARDTTKYLPGQKVEIGFTWKYAHPLLTDPYRGARVSKPERAKNPEFDAEKILPVIDIFAFGRTLQEVLMRLEMVHGDSIYSNYVLNFLHVVACLALDGQNSSNGPRASSFVSDRALDMPAALFAAHKFENFKQIVVVLERLLGMRRLEDELPEVDRWSSSTINISDLGPTTLTPRVSSLLNHPAMQRLSAELQLGKLDTVFPTATHTRLQHSFGVYHDSREYISALYYDAENPTFRILFSPADGKKCLVATLVHDLGQTSFGHDLEEVDKEIFSHERITERILKSDFYKDAQNRTLRQIIEGDGYDCWGIELDRVLDLIKPTVNRPPVEGLFRDIVSGQLDADKLDYLLRDSVECRVKYGHGIDYERFLRSLTTKASLNGRNAILRLAVEQKGAASAEAFAFARYQMFQSVYWHHTFRAVKAMLLDAATWTLLDLRQKYPETNLVFNEAILSAFLSYVLKFEPRTSREYDRSRSTSSKSRTEPLDKLWIDIDERVKSPATPDDAGKYSRDETLVFFWKLATGKARTVLGDLIARNYYKRVFEISLGDLPEDQQLWIRDSFRPKARIKFREAIEEALLRTIRRAIQSQSTMRESLVTDEVMERMESIAATKMTFAIDLPLRAWKSEGDPPVFVSDYKRRHFRSSLGEDTGPHDNQLWSNYLPALMKGKAFFRVYCEPELHKLLIRVLHAIDVSETLRAEFFLPKPQF